MTRTVLAGLAAAAMLAIAGSGPASAQANNLKQLSVPPIGSTKAAITAQGAAKIEVPNLKLSHSAAGANAGPATGSPSRAAGGPEWKYVPVRR